MTWLKYVQSSPIISLSIIAILISVIGFFPLLGLPGALVYAQWQYLCGFLGYNWLFPELTGDKAWPTYLLISIFWPLCLPLGGLLSKQLLKSGLQFSSLILCLIFSYIIWSFLISALISRIVK